MWMQLDKLLLERSDTHCPHSVHGSYSLTHRERERERERFGTLTSEAHSRSSYGGKQDILFWRVHVIGSGKRQKLQRNLIF
jgi:hypothetical protein